MSQETPPEAFDVEGTFAPCDYRYFYDPVLTEKRSEREVGQIWQLLGLQPGMTVLDVACGYGRIANRLAARGCLVSGLDQQGAPFTLASRRLRVVATRPALPPSPN
uniref:Methyltransferase domain-containing protein n=1 Tax=Thermogemmatispora argillosa TaxID=2045280 RepID=A0A455T4V0_9CHLR|nr:hypothetical protein KTA_24300 [Thermogemmatispora argillosa]